MWQASDYPVRCFSRMRGRIHQVISSSAQQFQSLADIFLQIAILPSSISALLKQKTIRVAGAAVGICGLVQFSNGFLMFMQVNKLTVVNMKQA